ncbi:MAG: NAD(P)/FAD-dependent oxidoreductase [Nocardioidaceae bacterium]
MSSTATHVIVGASLAGAKAAETLRAEGFDGRVVLIGAETHPPYERPPLSKQVLRGEADPRSALVHEEGFYADHDIELHLGTRVAGIDPGARTVSTTLGDIGYDRLLLTTGSRARRLRLPGSDLPGVHYLRDLDDLASLQVALASASRVAVVGAGWIGSEVAASARQTGHDVTLLDLADTPLQAVVGNEIGQVFARLHADHGVRLRLGTAIEGFVGGDRVTGVRTGREVVDADLVVVGVGAIPRTELAQAAGLAVDNGVCVDEYLRTGADGVFAAGDVAAVWNEPRQRRFRVEHWANALHQGEAAARSMLGAGTPYRNVPFFFSDQYDLGLEYCGYPVPWDRVVVRGDQDAREFIAFWLAGDHVVAAMNVNTWDVNERLQELVAERRPVDDARLADPETALEKL